MPFGIRVVLRSAVHFYGVKAVEADEDSSMRATVEIPGPSGARAKRRSCR